MQLLWFPAAQSAPEKWLTHKSTHFVIYYKSASEGVIQQLSARAEEYYDKIADDLGFRRYNFWLWDNRASIYLHDDRESYQKATGQPSWSSGAAEFHQKVIHSFLGATGFFETVLPHEMGHIIFREFVGFDNSAVPLWLDEGVASYQGDVNELFVKNTLCKAIAEKKFISLPDLGQIDLRSLRDEATIKLFYTEAVGVILYLIKTFGKEAFVFFCQSLRDKRDLERALASAFKFGTTLQLNEAWTAALQK
jgi:hypothetical protein